MGETKAAGILAKDANKKIGTELYSVSSIRNRYRYYTKSKTADENHQVGENGLGDQANKKLMETVPETKSQSTDDNF
jgi:hypothetical protein